MGLELMVLQQNLLVSRCVVAACNSSSFGQMSFGVRKRILLKPATIIKDEKMGGSARVGQ